MAAMEIKDIITLIIAVYGALLSTFNLILSFVQNRKRVKVRTGAFYDFKTDDQSKIPRATLMVYVEVVNCGKSTIVVNAPEFIAPNGTAVIVEPDKYPLSLQEGQATKHLVRVERIRSWLKESGYTGRVELKPKCTSTTGRQYFGSEWICDMDQATSL